MLQAEFGMDEFNELLRGPMRARLMEALTMRSLQAKDASALEVSVCG